MINKKCIICGTNKFANVLYPATFTGKDLKKEIFSARRMPDRVHYALWKCGRCGLIFSNPILPTKKIEKLYQKSSLSYEGQIGYLRKDYGRLLRQTGEKLLTRENFLEIGCGNGFMLEEALTLGFKNVYGVEPSKEAVEKAFLEVKGNITVDIFKAGQFKNNFFDLVCFFQTLDHVPEPEIFLREVYSILKPGGIAVCVCHNTESLGARVFGEKWPIFDIEHIYLFNKKNLEKIFAKAGFGEIFVCDFQNNYPLSYWIHLLPIPKGVKKEIVRFLAKFKFLDFNFQISAGNIVLVVKKQKLASNMLISGIFVDPK